jgi:hypothetical protein
MNTNLFCFRSLVVAFALVAALATTASAAASEVTAQLDRTAIALGDSAQLTISVSGDSADNISPPVVPGLEFDAVGQSSQFQSINGVATSTTSITYAVTPQRAGNFTIPAFGPGSQPIVLHVQSGNGASNATAGNNATPSRLPPPTMSGSSDGDGHAAAEGAAFARLVLPKHELYVGETVPVEIQVGVRPGLVAQLDGLPTLNGDSFTLNKLSDKPEQTQEVIGNAPYTVLTWRSVLAAVKPGDFSLSVETPLTVQIHTAPARRAQMPRDLFGDSGFDDPFSDPFFQSFFAGTTEKQITVASEPDTLKVQELPAVSRPAGFSGAVGNFQTSSELSANTSTAGDPLTLRLKVTGTGNFDRVSSPMLGTLDGWKTYRPTAIFAPADSAGYSGEKVFEQAVIPTQSGRETVPALAFSFFNPDTRRYETKLTAPLSVQIAPVPGGSSAATAVSATGATQDNETPHDGLRPDLVETGGTVATLRPLYFQPWFLGTQGALILGFSGGLVILRRREQRAHDVDGARQRESTGAITACLNEMDTASANGDITGFFQSARAALQQSLGTRWHVAPASITMAEIDVRLNGNGTDIRRIFALADQAAYSGQTLTTSDLRQWTEIVREQLKQMEAL